MFRYKHSAEHWRVMSDKKRAYIEIALSKLERYITDGRFDSELAKSIIQQHAEYADTILLIYSGLLHAKGFHSKSMECLKTLCGYYDAGVLKNTAHYKARAFLTYASSIRENFKDNPTPEDFERVAKNIGKAIALDKNYREARLGWCLFLRMRARFNEAKENFEKLLELHPDYPDAYHNYAIFLWDNGEKDLSMQIRKRFVDKYPHDIKALWFYALDTLNLLEDCKEAIRLLLKTLSLLGASSDPEKISFKAKIYLALGIAHRNIGEFDLAGKAFQKAAELDPHNAGVKSAQAHSKQDKGGTSHKHPGKRMEKIRSEFNEARQLDPERFARNHSDDFSQTSSSVFLIERQISIRRVDYSELTARLKFEKEMAEVENALAALDARVYECEEFRAFSDSLEFAEILATGKQFITASNELSQASQQYLTKLKWINSTITGTIREFDPEKKALLPICPREPVAITPPEKNITHTVAPSIASLVEPKPAALSVVKLPIKVKSLRDECLDLMAKISPLWQAHEKEFDKDSSDQLTVANKLFENGNYNIAQTKFLAMLKDLENQIKHIKEQKKLVATSSTLALSKTQLFKREPKSPPQKHLETRQVAQNKKNPAIMFASEKAPHKNNSASFSMYVLYFSLPATAIFFILYAFYNQLSSPPEQTHRFKI